MLWVPQKGIVRVEHNTGDVGTATPGTSLTTGASSTTKGTPVEIFAATAFDAYWVEIWASEYGNSNTASQGCLDVLIGAATEEVLIPNLLMGYAGPLGVAGSFGVKMWAFPLYIPAGSRIAVQAAGARLSTALRCQMFLYGGNGYPPFRVGSKVTTYGVTVPNGITITPGASGAAGAFTQIAATTSEDHFALHPSWQATASTSMSGRTYAVQMGIGAATEKQVGPTYWYALQNTSERMFGPVNPRPHFQDIPAGTRLAMRASCNSTVSGTWAGAIHAVS